MDRDELRGCPFGDVMCHCDDLKVVTSNDPGGSKNVSYGYVECNNCGARGPMLWASTDLIHSLAVRAWNERRAAGLVPITDHARTIAELRAERDQARKWQAEAQSFAGAAITRAETAEAEVARLTRELEEARRVHRWNVDRNGENLQVCREDHDKGEKCEWETFVPLARAETAEAENARLKDERKAREDEYWSVLENHHHLEAEVARLREAAALALEGLEAGCAQYVAKTIHGHEVPGDEQFPWVRKMQIGRDALRAARQTIVGKDE